MAPGTPNPRPPSDDSLIQGRNGFSALVEGWITRWTPPCPQAARLLSDSLERPLAPRERLSLRTHFLVCCYCRRYGEQLHLLRRLTRALPDHLGAIPVDRLGDAAKSRIKTSLRSAE